MDNDVILSFLPPLLSTSRFARHHYLHAVCQHIERIIDRPAAVRWAGWRSRHSPVPRP